MCYSTMSLTQCYKTAVFLHLYFQFFYFRPQRRYRILPFLSVSIYFNLAVMRPNSSQVKQC